MQQVTFSPNLNRVNYPNARSHRMTLTKTPLLYLNKRLSWENRRLAWLPDSVNPGFEDWYR